MALIRQKLGVSRRSVNLIFGQLARSAEEFVHVGTKNSRVPTVPSTLQQSQLNQRAELDTAGVLFVPESVQFDIPVLKSLIRPIITARLDNGPATRRGG
jgi:hypothetical protein